MYISLQLTVTSTHVFSHSNSLFIFRSGIDKNAKYFRTKFFQIWNIIAMDTIVIFLKKKIYREVK